MSYWGYPSIYSLTQLYFNKYLWTLNIQEMCIQTNYVFRGKSNNRNNSTLDWAYPCCGNSLVYVCLTFLIQINSTTCVDTALSQQRSEIIKQNVTTTKKESIDKLLTHLGVTDSCFGECPAFRVPWQKLFLLGVPVKISYLRRYLHFIDRILLTTTGPWLLKEGLTLK